MHKCEVCWHVSEPREKVLKHVIYKTEKRTIMDKITKRYREKEVRQIERELIVCSSCQEDLESGLALEYLERIHKKTRKNIEAVRRRRISSERKAQLAN